MLVAILFTISLKTIINSDDFELKDVIREVLPDPSQDDEEIIQEIQPIIVEENSDDQEVIPEPYSANAVENSDDQELIQEVDPASGEENVDNKDEAIVEEVFQSEDELQSVESRLALRREYERNILILKIGNEINKLYEAYVLTNRKIVKRILDEHDLAKRKIFQKLEKLESRQLDTDEQKDKYENDLKQKLEDKKAKLKEKFDRKKRQHEEIHEKNIHKLAHKIKQWWIQFNAKYCNGIQCVADHSENEIIDDIKDELSEYWIKRKGAVVTSGDVQDLLEMLKVCGKRHSEYHLARKFYNMDFVHYQMVNDATMSVLYGYPTGTVEKYCGIYLYEKEQSEECRKQRIVFFKFSIKEMEELVLSMQ